MRESIAESLLEHELRCPDYLTYVARPKWAEQVETVSDLSPDGGEGTAIVIHGTMVYDDHFTRDTIRIYRRHYPEALIILSTWDDEDAEYLEDMREANVVVVTSPKPEYPGIGNSELLRVPAHAGVEEAVALGMTDVLITLSNHRLYAPNLVSFFRQLQDCFPLNETSKQSKRLIASAHGTHKHTPYCISPMVMFGSVADVLNYWDLDTETNNRQLKNNKTDKNDEKTVANTRLDFIRKQAVQYLSRIDVTMRHDSIDDYWKFLATYFCLIDAQLTDLYCHFNDAEKITGKIDVRNRSYTANNSHTMSFAKWLIMYNRLNAIDRIEK